MPRWTTFLVFISVVLLVFGGLHAYLFVRIDAWLGWTGFAGGALKATMASLAVLPVASRVLERKGPGIYRIAWWIASVWMGLAFYLLLFLLAGQAIESAVQVAGAWPGTQALRYTVGIPVVLALAVGGHGVWSAHRGARVTEREVQLRDLPPEADGMTIAQISDVHMGSIVGPHRVAAIVARLQGLAADAVVITGDLVDERPSRLTACVRAFAPLRPSLGIFAVTGNHEFYAGVDASVELMTNAGFRVLENEAVELRPGIVLAGFHDPTGIQWGDARWRSTPKDFDRVLGDRADGRTRIVLYHQPTFADHFERLGVDLMLCGHTHGGQLWPFRHLVTLRYRYVDGLYEVGAMLLNVCRGTATWGPPMRVGAPAEIVHFTLRRARE